MLPTNTAVCIPQVFTIPVPWMEMGAPSQMRRMDNADTSLQQDHVPPNTSEGPADWGGRAPRCLVPFQQVKHLCMLEQTSYNDNHPITWCTPEVHSTVRDTQARDYNNNGPNSNTNENTPGEKKGDISSATAAITMLTTTPCIPQ